MGVHDGPEYALDRCEKNSDGRSIHSGFFLSISRMGGMMVGSV